MCCLSWLTEFLSSLGDGGKAKLEVVLDDIVFQETDAIVNAADETLLGGTSVDGAIHAAAGPELLAETRKLGGCMTGAAKVTAAFNLPSSYIIHAVAPIYDGLIDKNSLLASAYESSIELAQKMKLASISFPALGAGAYGWPLEPAAKISVKALKKALRRPGSLRLVRLVAFSERNFRILEKAAGVTGQRIDRPGHPRIYHPGASGSDSAV